MPSYYLEFSLHSNSSGIRYAHIWFGILANFAAFEIDDEVLGNLREYALANSLFWALAEGHACEQSARRNAMDNASKVSLLSISTPRVREGTMKTWLM